MKANKIFKNNMLLPALLAAAISGGAIAAPGDPGTLTNNITGVGQPGTPGYENTVPVICLSDDAGNLVASVPSGQTIGIANSSGGALRMNGCTATDT